MDYLNVFDELPGCSKFGQRIFGNRYSLSLLGELLKPVPGTSQQFRSLPDILIIEQPPVKIALNDNRFEPRIFNKLSIHGAASQMAFRSCQQLAS